MREQLFNAGEVGPVERVSTAVDAISSVRGVMIDIDLDRFRPEYLRCPGNAPDFLDHVIAPMLGREPTLDQAEVRSSGTGLHVLLWLREPVEFETDGERQRWCGIVKALQRLLPSDPGAPGLNALTRPLGSINAKNLAEVRCLREGQPVAIRDLIALYERAREAPFRTIANIFFGDRISPCPVCSKPDTRLGVMDLTGRCYNGCDSVQVPHLYDAILRRKEVARVQK